MLTSLRILAWFFKQTKFSWLVHQLAWVKRVRQVWPRAVLATLFKVTARQRRRRLPRIKRMRMDTPFAQVLGIAKS